MIEAFTPAIRKCTAMLLAAVVLVSPAMAQDQGTSVRAAAGILPPLVMKQEDQLTGFSIDMWNEIARWLKLTTSYQVAPDVDNLFASLRTKSTNVIATGVFYTTERDRKFNRNDVGFLFQLDDARRRRVSSVVVALHEDGTCQRLYEKWFGSE